MKNYKTLFLFIVSTILVSCSILDTDKYQYGSAGYSVTKHLRKAKTESYFFDRNYAILNNNKHLKKQTILEKTVNDKLALTFTYVDGFAYTCEQEVLSDLLNRFFDSTDGYGYSLKKSHQVEVVFLENFSYHKFKKIEQIEKIYSTFYMPIIPCEEHKMISKHFYLYFLLLSHEIYHVDDVFDSSLTPNRNYFEFIATKKSYCDFLLSSGFRKLYNTESYAKDDSINKKHDDEGYGRFWELLYEKVNTLTVLANTEEHEKAKQWCLE